MNKLPRIDKSVNHHDNYAIHSEDGLRKGTKSSTLELYHKEMWQTKVRDLDVFIQRRVTEVSFGGKPIVKVQWDFCATNDSQHMSQTWTEEEAAKMLTALGLHLSCSAIGPLEPCEIWAD